MRETSAPPTGVSDEFGLRTLTDPGGGWPLRREPLAPPIVLRRHHCVKRNAGVHRLRSRAGEPFASSYQRTSAPSAPDREALYAWLSPLTRSTPSVMRAGDETQKSLRRRRRHSPSAPPAAGAGPAAGWSFASRRAKSR